MRIPKNAMKRMLCWKNKVNQISLFTNKTKCHRVPSAAPPTSSLGASVSLQAPNAGDQYNIRSSSLDSGEHNKSAVLVRYIISLHARAFP